MPDGSISAWRARLRPWRRLAPALMPAQGTAAARTARAAQRFQLVSALALATALVLAAAIIALRIDGAGQAAGLASLAARQPALAQRLALLDIATPGSGDNAAYDSTLAQLIAEQSRLRAAAAGLRDGAGGALHDLYGGTGYSLGARLDDLFQLARSARDVGDPAAQAPLLTALRREITDQVAGRLAEAAELFATLAQQRWDSVTRALLAAAAAGAALAAIWLLASLALLNRLRRTLGLLEWLAARDGLTGALTQSAFLARLRQLLRRGGVGLVLFDLDSFHALNAASGDAAGDAALRAVARRLRQAAGPGALVARLGSDSFAVALADPGERLAATAETLRAALRDPVPFEGQLLRVSASGGTVLAPQDSTERGELLRMAGVAVREAKREAKGSVRAFHSLEPAAQARREAVLRAITDGDLTGVEPWLQPLVRCDGGQPVRFEVLARWTHPRLGRVPPAEFLPIAEAVGRLPLLSAHVRNQAFLALAALHATLRPAGKAGAAGEANTAKPLPGVAVNLAPSELSMPGMLTDLEAAMTAAELPLAYLTIEVTEDMLIEGVDADAYAGLQALRARGARVNLDNFGSGVANLQHLRRFALDGLKIARPFIAAIGEDPRAEIIIRGVLGLSTGLGIETVAEGVETEAQMAFIRAAGCDLAQGFHIAAPMAPGDVAAWMARSSRLSTGG